MRVIGVKKNTEWQRIILSTVSTKRKTKMVNTEEVIFALLTKTWKAKRFEVSHNKETIIFQGELNDTTPMLPGKMFLFKKGSIKLELDHDQ